MEKITLLLTAAILAWILIRSLFVPMKLGFRMLLHGAGGLACLWILNCAAAVTGLYLPVNPVTVLLSGVLGLPGIGLVALLTLF